MTLGEIAAALGPSSKLRGDREPGLSAEGWFYADHQVYPYGNHLAVVKVDPDTGGVKVLRYVIGYDIGRAINPTLVKGQIAGGFAQGLGGALMEEFTYNESGDPLAVTFADYLLPTVRETPDMEIILTEDYPSPLNPLGIKGAGESGVNARRRRHRVRDRRRHRHSGRDHAASGDAAAAEGDPRREEVIAKLEPGGSACRVSPGQTFCRWHSAGAATAWRSWSGSAGRFRRDAGRPAFGPAGPAGHSAHAPRIALWPPASPFGAGLSTSPAAPAAPARSACAGRSRKVPGGPCRSWRSRRSRAESARRVASRSSPSA